MAQNGTILVGTVGQGIMMSDDAGDTWIRNGVSQGMHSDCIIRCQALDPRHPEVVWAGSDLGLYRTDDAGRHWKLLNTPMSGKVVWSLAVDKADPNLMYAGTGTPSMPGFFRSCDGGKTWEQREVEIADECINVGTPRFTGIAIDPVNRNSLWAGLEVDGLRHSKDGGDSWEKVNGTRIPNPDVHSVLVVAGPPKTVFCVVNNDVFTSTDDGVTWKALGVKEVLPYTYPRSITAKPNDPKTAYLAIGDATPGTIGTVMCTRDAGVTWQDLKLCSPSNSAMWTVGINPSDPEVVFASSRYGNLYRSDDGGSTWTRLWREFSEVSSVAWLPE